MNEGVGFRTEESNVSKYPCQLSWKETPLHVCNTSSHVSVKLKSHTGREETNQGQTVQ